VTPHDLRITNSRDYWDFLKDFQPGKYEDPDPETEKWYIVNVLKEIYYNPLPPPFPENLLPEDDIQQLISFQDQIDAASAMKPNKANKAT